jgi:hypothetical protein
MRIPMALCILSLLSLLVLLPATANLVGTAGNPQWQADTMTVPVMGQSPVSLIGNNLSDPLLISSNTAVKPVTAAAINSPAMDLAWSPVLSTGLSPFQDISSLGGASVEVRSIDNILGSIMSTTPPGVTMSDNMDWSF